jgi:hypothetical protein
MEKESATNPNNQPQNFDGILGLRPGMCKRKEDDGNERMENEG